MKRLLVTLLAASAVAAVFILPANASARSSHRVLRSSARALHAPSVGDRVQKPGAVSLAWTAAAPMPVALGEQGGGAALGNFFWAIGGYDTTFTTHNNNQRYNKGTNTWAAGAPIPGTGGGWADAAFCVNPSDKTIHVVNGTDGSFLYTAHQVYNPLTNTWTLAAAPNTPADGFYYSQDSGCAFIGGKMYLYGGYGLTDTNPSAALQVLTWVYDPATDTWTDTGKTMPNSYLWSGYTHTGTAAYVAGGYDLGFVPHVQTKSFTPAGGWTVGPNLPQALGGPGEGNVSGHALVWGGITSAGTMSNKTYGCSLPGCASWATTSFNLPVAKGFFAWGSGGSLYSGGGFDSAFTALTAAEHLP